LTSHGNCSLASHPNHHPYLKTATRDFDHTYGLNGELRLI
jgi:hypothetical protein